MRNVNGGKSTFPIRGQPPSAEPPLRRRWAAWEIAAISAVITAGLLHATAAVLAAW